MFYPSSQFTQRWYQWTSWKAMNAIKGGQYQYDYDNVSYTIWFYDGPEVHICSIYDGYVPDGIIDGGYSQSQNDSDLYDFQTNFLSNANATIEPRAADGRADVRTTVASKAKNFNLKVFSFTPGDPTSLVNLDNNFNVLSDVTMTCFDSSDNITTNQASAVMTQLDWEPTYNYEIIGGWMSVPPSITGGAPKTWYVNTTGVPDISATLGGSVPFIGTTDMALNYIQQIISDGRASQYLIYNNVYHTNKIRWKFKHPANSGGLFTPATPGLQIYVEIFV